LLLHAYEGLNAKAETAPQATYKRDEALDRLIQLYTETNKPDEVKKWQAEKDKLLGQFKKEPPPKK